MKKKFIYALIAVCCIGGGLYFSLSEKSTPSLSSENCAFCNQKILDYQKFYEDDLVLALYTHKPILDGHCLVISKRHVERFDGLSAEEMMRIGQVIQKVDRAVVKVFHTPSYFLLQKNGVEAWQTVPHVHFHYIPRPSGDASSLTFLAKMWIANLKKPISPARMHEVVEQLQQAMESDQEDKTRRRKGTEAQKKEE